MSRLPSYCRTGTIYSLILFLLLLFNSSQTLAERVRHQILADAHPLVLWEKSPAKPRGHILLLHGRTWSSLPDFDLQVEAEDLSLMDGLNRLGYAAWALDARGYGATLRDKTGWLTPDRAVKDVAIVLDWLADQGITEVHLFGWSYGSMVAQLTSQRHPDRVSSLVLYGYPIDPDRQIEDPEYPKIPPAKANTRKNARSDFIVPGSISKNAIDTYVTEALQADPVRVDWRDLSQWNELDGARVKVPTLLLQAEFDPLADTASHARLFASIPNANKQWVVLAGGDHAALLEKPRNRLLQATIAFIEWLGW